MALIVALDVGARVMVTALVSWNEIVKVNDAVRGQTGDIGNKMGRAASITPTVSFEITSAATITRAARATATIRRRRTCKG